MSDTEPPVTRRRIGCLVIAVLLVGVLALAGWGLEFF
jgi:hypothetical protein